MFSAWEASIIMVARALTRDAAYGLWPICFDCGEVGSSSLDLWVCMAGRCIVCESCVVNHPCVSSVWERE